MNRDFRVGDEVTCSRYGKGVVISRRSKRHGRPISVGFPNGGWQTYTEEGHIGKSTACRHLYHGHFDINDVLQEAEIKPVRKFKRYVNLYPTHNVGTVGQFISSKTYPSKESALEGSCEGAVATAVKIEINGKLTPERLQFESIDDAKRLQFESVEDENGFI